MKKIFFVLATILSTLMISCDEQLETFVYEYEAPMVSSFSPSSGVVGTQIAIEGENLQNVSKAYINDIEVKISSRTSNSYITIEATASGRSGVIKIESTEGSATTTESFTYSYPTPVVTKAPLAFVAGEQVFIEGTNLLSVSQVWINPTSGTGVLVEDFSSSDNEITFKVPNVPAGDAKLEFVFFDGNNDASADVADMAVVNDGINVVTLLDKTYAMGEQVVVDGSGLAVVEKVLVNGVEQNLIGAPTATQLTFQIVDDVAFADGLNTTELTFVVTGDEVKFTKENFKITMPMFYKWTSCKVSARNGDSNFFNFENGRSYSKTQIATLDPVTVANNFQAHTAPNVLASAVSDEQYYSVDPYIYQFALGSGAPLYGPAANPSRMGGIGSPIASSAYGTPSVILVTLDSSDETENTIINKINNGTFTDEDFDAQAFKQLDMGSRSVKGELGVASYAPEAPSKATMAYSDNPNTVVLVMYMKPNRDSWKFSMDNVYKFGFMDVNNLTYVEGDAHAANVTFDAYWQRTPLK